VYRFFEILPRPCPDTPHTTPQGIHIGDALVSVNNSILSNLPSKNALIIINDGNIMRKTFSFMNQAEYYRNKVREVFS
jgi:hypothetical protein